MNGRLIIKNVDFGALEEQRNALRRIIKEAGDLPVYFTGEDIKLLEGLNNMLDAWSDERYLGNFN